MPLHSFQGKFLFFLRYRINDNEHLIVMDRKVFLVESSLIEYFIIEYNYQSGYYFSAYMMLTGCYDRENNKILYFKAFRVNMDPNII